MRTTNALAYVKLFKYIKRIAVPKSGVLTPLGTLCIIGLAVWWYKKRSEQTQRPTPQDREGSVILLSRSKSLVSTIKIHSLFVYPIKSCRGIKVNTIHMTKTGLEVDRKLSVGDTIYHTKTQHL